MIRRCACSDAQRMWSESRVQARATLDMLATRQQQGAEDLQRKMDKGKSRMEPPRQAPGIGSRPIPRGRMAESVSSASALARLRQRVITQAQPTTLLLQRDGSTECPSPLIPSRWRILHRPLRPCTTRASAGARARPQSRLCTHLLRIRSFPRGRTWSLERSVTRPSFSDQSSD